MALLKKTVRKFLLGPNASQGRKSLYDFAVVSIAVWLLGGLAAMIVWGPSEENQVPGPLAAKAPSARVPELRELENELHNAEDAYQRAAAELNDAAIEHALHRQSVGTFLARHFRDVSAETERVEQSSATSTALNPRWLALNRAVTTLASERRKMLDRVSPAHPRVVEIDVRLSETRMELASTPREVQYGDSLTRETGGAVTMPSLPASASWGSQTRGSFFVTTEGPSATYELPRKPRTSSSVKPDTQGQLRYQQLEGAAHASGGQLEKSVLAERNAWARMQETFSLYQAALAYSASDKNLLDDAQSKSIARGRVSGPTTSLPVLPLGLASVTGIALVAGYALMRNVNHLSATESRTVSSPKELATELRLPLLGTLPAPSVLFAEARRQLAARMRLHGVVEHGRFAAEAVVGGAFLLWVMLALFQPGFAERFFDQPARAVAEVASWL